MQQVKCHQCPLSKHQINFQGFSKCVAMLGDIFEEREDISRTFQLTRDKLFKLGYRDGVISGKQASMQAGFDAGFAHVCRLLVITGMTPEEAMRLVPDTKNIEE